MPPTVSQVSPANSTQKVSASLKTLNFTIQNPEGGPMSYYVSLEPGGFKDQASGVSDGKYSVVYPGAAVRHRVCLEAGCQEQ